MNKTLQKILRKVEVVQHGLLKCDQNDQRVMLPARAGSCEFDLNCVVNQEKGHESLLEKNVNLIQKDKEDYIYITCRVKEEVVRNSAVIVSMEVLKACWFTRKSKGSVSWLKEKYIYELNGLAS